MRHAVFILVVIFIFGFSSVGFAWTTPCQHSNQSQESPISGDQQHAQMTEQAAEKHDHSAGANHCKQNCQGDCSDSCGTICSSSSGTLIGVENQFGSANPSSTLNNSYSDHLITRETTPPQRPPKKFLS